MKPETRELLAPILLVLNIVWLVPAMICFLGWIALEWCWCRINQKAGA